MKREGVAFFGGFGVGMAFEFDDASFEVVVGAGAFGTFEVSFGPLVAAFPLVNIFFTPPTLAGRSPKKIRYPQTMRKI